MGKEPPYEEFVMPKYFTGDYFQRVFPNGYQHSWPSLFVGANGTERERGKRGEKERRKRGEKERGKRGNGENRTGREGREMFYRGMHRSTIYVWCMWCIYVSYSYCVL